MFILHHPLFLIKLSSTPRLDIHKIAKYDFFPAHQQFSDIGKNASLSAYWGLIDLAKLRSFFRTNGMGKQCTQSRDAKKNQQLGENEASRKGPIVALVDSRNGPFKKWLREKQSRPIESVIEVQKVNLIVFLCVWK